jgi:ABC-2 type transport system permease protein
MKGFWPIYKRELFAFFVTPLAWILILVFLFVQGMHFFLLVDTFARQNEVGADQSPLQVFFGDTALLYMILFLLVPAMTMRLFAEERRSGTMETLLSAPVSSAAVVLGKYAAVVTTYVAMWVPTLLYIVILRRTGEIDAGVALSSYLGVALVGAAYLAVGLFASALTKSQLVALVITALVLLGFFILGMSSFVAREGTTLHVVATHVSVWSAMNDFSAGLVDSRRLVFYGSLIVLPLYLATRTVDSWR